MYKILGWTNAIVTLVLILPFALQAVSKKKDGVLHSIIKFLRKAHKLIGAVILISIATHGIMALGSFALHTGTVAGIAFVVAALFGMLFLLFKKKQLYKTHRILAYIYVLIVIVHLLLPSLL